VSTSEQDTKRGSKREEQTKQKPPELITRPNRKGDEISTYPEKREIDEDNRQPMSHESISNDERVAPLTTRKRRTSEQEEDSLARWEQVHSERRNRQKGTGRRQK